MPAWALYKVVGPNGEVTYTDRPPTDGKNAAPLKSVGRSATSTDGLPYRLQQIAERYPVTLFTNDRCSPCGQGRQLLTRRGVPFTEKTVNSDADIRAFKASTGTDQLPTLKVGNQLITGFSDSEWNTYLSAAGYPEQSTLPPQYKAAPPTPMVVVTPSTKPKAEEAPPPPSTISPPASGDAPPGFRF